jgi:hypothetical protein
MQMMSGYWVAQALYVAATLGVADRLRDGPETAEALASATGAHAGSLFRLLRALSSLGVLAQDGQGRFALTPLGAALQSGPGTARAMVLHLGERPSWNAWGELLHCVRTGQTAFPRANGQEVFAYYGAHPESAEPFNQAMTEYSEAVSAAVVRAYGFSGISTLVDVGGGHGSLLAAILEANPRLKGIVFDLPEVVAGARVRIEAEGLGGRCELAGGDFFASVPSGADAYILKAIIHDWDDERALAILRNVHGAMAAEGKLLLAELVVPPGGEGALSKLSDLHMMVMTGGRERTEAEYGALLGAAGFRLTRIIPTESLVSVIEGVRD